MFFESRRPAHAGTGLLLFALGIFLFALNDALAKWLMAGVTSQQLLLFRTVGAACVLVPMALRTPWHIRLREQWGLHAIRIACMTADTFAFYLATKYLPLADVMTFYLASPLMITALSVPILHEKVGPFRWTAVLVGFAGIVVALDPTEAAFSGAALLALFGACMFAGAIITTRKLRDTHWLGLIFWQFVGSAIVGAAASPIGWKTPSLLDIALMSAVGIFALSAFVCITRSLNLTDASAVAPLTYTSIVWAGILGWLIWGDVPSRNTVIGIVIIVCSGLAVWWREQKRELVSPRPVPAP